MKQQKSYILQKTLYSLWKKLHIQCGKKQCRKLCLWREKNKYQVCTFTPLCPKTNLVSHKIKRMFLVDKKSVVAFMQRKQWIPYTPSETPAYHINPTPASFQGRHQNERKFLVQKKLLHTSILFPIASRGAIKSKGGFWLRRTTKILHITSILLLLASPVGRHLYNLSLIWTLDRFGLPLPRNVEENLKCFLLQVEFKLYSLI